MFWHLGTTTAIVIATLGRRRIDFRVVLLGSILPDLIDKPIGRILFVDQFQTGRIYGHTLAFSLGLFVLILLFLRGERLRKWFILPIACFLHLALDGMWADPITLFWPLFGTQFPPVVAPDYWLDVLLRPFENQAVAIQEVVGIALTIYLVVAFRLHHSGPRREFLRKGALLADRDLPDPRTS